MCTNKLIEQCLTSGIFQDKLKIDNVNQLHIINNPSVF